KPRRAGTAEVRHRERNGSAPCCKRRAVGASPSARLGAGRPTRRLEIDPLVQRPRPTRIGGEILDELRHARIAPSVAEVGPDLQQCLAAKGAANEGERVDGLYQAVGG